MSTRDENTKFFEQLVKTYYKQVKKFIFIITLDEVLAAQAAQKTFSVVWKQIEDYRKAEDLSKSVNSSARKVLLEEFKGEESAPNSRPDLTFLEDLEIPAFLNEEKTDIGLESEILKEYFDSLNIDQLRVLLLHFYHDLTFNQIEELYRYNYVTKECPKTEKMRPIKYKGAETKQLCVVYQGVVD